MGSAGWGFGAAFLGSAVESVEALTIVLAVGVTRGWRAPLQGTLAALLVLAALVLSLGQVLTSRVPDSVLKSVIGGLVLLFGLRWLHKAILRSAGVIAMSDERDRYATTVQGVGVAARLAGVDWPAFAVAFKGVFLEGLEVAFIVFAVGASSGNLRVASAGGLVAMVVVALLGVALRRPLTRVPENTIKHTVGVLLASLGTFWAGEGFGVQWPLDAVSVLALVAIYAGAARLAVLLLRTPSRRRAAAGAG
jgi:Ca2+/H+ antiporter, TMEM165/GDT1 family